MSTNDELKNETANDAKPVLCDVFFEDDELQDDDEQTPPDYYQCMCCGHIQSRSYSCNRCAGPMSECWY